MSEHERPVLNVTGEKVALGPLRRDLLPLYQKWVNDWEVTRTVGGMRPWTWEAEEDWYERASKREGDVIFTIYERGALRAIGTAASHDVNHRHRTAEFGILIGEKDCWGKGYGTEATRLTLGYAFGTLGLHNVTLSVHADNERAIRAYTRAGFQVVGRRREVVRRAGRCLDLVLMDCLAREFSGD